MTDIQFANLLVGDSIHWGNCTRVIGPRGGVKETCVAYRVTRIQTWKRDTSRRVVSVARGMYDHAKLSADNMAHVAQWHESRHCPLNVAGPTMDAPHVARVQEVAAPILGDMTFYRVVCTCGLVTQETISESYADAMRESHVRDATDASTLNAWLSSRTRANIEANIARMASESTPS